MSFVLKKLALDVTAYSEVRSLVRAEIKHKPALILVNVLTVVIYSGFLFVAAVPLLR